MAKNWLDIRVRTEKSKQKHVQAQLTNFADGPQMRYLFQHMQSITAAGADVGRNYMKYNKAVITRTGEERAARGEGIAGRQDTGAMIEAFKWDRGRKIGPAKYKITVGWLEGKPGYAFFQEHGTKNGVRAMNALGYTTEFMRKELALLGTGRGIKVANAKPWDFDRE